MTARTRRQFLTVLGGAAAAAALAACGDDPAPTGAATATPGTSASGSAGATGGAPRTVRVATFAKNHAAAPLYWPQFAPPGYEVEVTTLSSGTEMNQALERGDLDFALFGLVNGFVQAEEGIGSKIVCMGAEEGASLVVAADGPVQEVADLAGKRIGFKGPAFQYLLLLELLEGAGLDPEQDVTLVPVEWNEMPAALARGDIDAYMGTEPNPSRSVADGTGRRLEGVYDTPAGRLNSAIWASRTAAEDPGLVAAACEMQRRAAELLSPDGENDPEVWRDLTVDQFGYEPAVYEALLPNVGAVWRFDEPWVEMARAQGRRMAAVGLLRQEPAYDEILQLDHQPS